MLHPRTLALLICASGLAAAGAGSVPIASVSGVVSVASKGAPDHGNAVIWLTPLGGVHPPGAAENARPRVRPTILQQNKRFEPHLLVVQAGSTVDFPNLDPFFHNVFSLFDGNRFDLGLYEAGSSRSVAFTRPGVCYVFCNIHPEMSAVVVAVDTPYYAVSNRDGSFVVPNVPFGRYALSVWHERGKPEKPADFPQELTIWELRRAVGTIRLVESDSPIVAHKNKYGHDYVPPRPTGPVYK
jgi:plastocyanin